MDNPYKISKPIEADPELSKCVISSLQETIGEMFVKEGMNCSADSFYGSEGRFDPGFIDGNSNLLQELKEKNPDICSLEMETFKLLSLAKMSKDPIYACGAAIGLVDREQSNFKLPAAR
jgi:uridine phosphorylase